MSDIEIVLPGASVALDPQASGFAHGFGLFETMRLRGGRLELWEAHWQRFARSAGELGMAFPFDQKAVFQAVQTLAKELPADAVIKLSLMKEASATRLLVYPRPMNPLPDSIGLLMDCPGRIDEASPLVGHKTHNYIENLLVFEAAHAAGCYDGLRLNTQGHIAEGAMSNIFFYRDGCLHTPSLETGLLPGVVREAFIEVVEVQQQGSYTLTNLLAAEAVFLANSSIGLQPVDYLLSGGEKIQIPSRKHPCYESARSLLSGRIEASAISL